MGCINGRANNVEEYWNTINQSNKLFSTFPEGRWNEDVNKIFSDAFNEKEVLGSFIENFEFPWMKFRIPPNVLGQIDNGQLMAADEAIDDYGKDKLVPARTAVYVGGMQGMESSILANLRIRQEEYVQILKNMPEFKNLDSKTQESIISDLQSQIRQYIPKIEEDTLPGFMDNIVAGRIANYFNVHGVNMFIDSSL
ncbi:MAG: hypothetical protein KAX49_08045 [Halanaerobiales bacterium]|nr:hypothetical protein [Halanaerobiales bacterium]